MINLPPNVKKILDTLSDKGFEAYIVGGCVRDYLLGKEPSDWDITTSAKPEEVKEIFDKTVDTGLAHGTVTVLIDNDPYEVTTYRVDGDYLDGRHPSYVKYTRSLREDLKRRDFTINAIAYNEFNGIRDYFYGREDLKNRVIRAVGIPENRFIEDSLRMMRAIRFSAQLGFNIDMKTYQAIIKLSHLIKNISIERVQVELTKTLLSKNPGGVIEYQLTGLFLHILPEINALLNGREASLICAFLKHVPDTAIMKYAALLHTLSYREAASILKRLKLDNTTINTVAQIIRYADEENKLEENETAVRKAIYNLGPKLMEHLFVFNEARIRLKEDTTGLVMRGSRNHLKNIYRIYKEILERKDAVSLKDLAISGDDLLELGMFGKKIGETLEWLMQIVLENPKLNEKETLLALLK